VRSASASQYDLSTFRISYRNMEPDFSSRLYKPTLSAKAKQLDKKPDEDGGDTQTVTTSASSQWRVVSDKNFRASESPRRNRPQEFWSEKGSVGPIEPDFNSRLYRPTKSHKQREAAKKEEQEERAAPNWRLVPAPTTPGWRLVSDKNFDFEELEVRKPPAKVFNVKSKHMTHTVSSAKNAKKEDTEEAVKPKSVPISENSHLFVLTKAAKAATWAKATEKQPTPNGSSSGHTPKKPFSPAGPSVKVVLDSPTQQKSSPNAKLDHVKSRLFAPTQSILQAKYVPPDPLDGVQILKGSKIDYGAKSKLFALTASAKHSRYEPPRREESPQKKYRVVLKRTFSDSELLELQERRAARTRTSSTGRGRSTDNRRSSSVDNRRSSSVDTGTKRLMRRRSDPSADEAAATAAANGTTVVNFTAPRMTKLALQRLQRDKDNRDYQSDRMSVGDSAGGPHSNYGCYNNKYHNSQPLPGEPADFVFSNGTHKMAGARSATNSVAGSNTSSLSPRQRRAAQQRLYTSNKPVYYGPSSRDVSPQRGPPLDPSLIYLVCVYPFTRFLTLSILTFFGCVCVYQDPPSIEKKPPMSPEERRAAMERLCKPNASMRHSQWIPSEYELRERAAKSGRPYVRDTNPHKLFCRVFKCSWMDSQEDEEEGEAFINSLPAPTVQTTAAPIRNTSATTTPVKRRPSVTKAATAEESPAVAPKVITSSTNAVPKEVAASVSENVAAPVDSISTAQTVSTGVTSEPANTAAKTNAITSSAPTAAAANNTAAAANPVLAVHTPTTVSSSKKSKASPKSPHSPGANNDNNTVVTTNSTHSAHSAHSAHSGHSQHTTSTSNSSGNTSSSKNTKNSPKKDKDATTTPARRNSRRNSRTNSPGNTSASSGGTAKSNNSKSNNSAFSKATVAKAGSTAAGAGSNSSVASDKSLQSRQSMSPVQFRTVASLDKVFPALVTPTAQRFTPSADGCFTSSPRTIKSTTPTAAAAASVVSPSAGAVVPTLAVPTIAVVQPIAVPASPRTPQQPQQSPQAQQSPAQSAVLQPQPSPRQIPIPPSPKPPIPTAKVVSNGSFFAEPLSPNTASSTNLRSTAANILQRTMSASNAQQPQQQPQSVVSPQVPASNASSNGSANSPSEPATPRKQKGPPPLPILSLTTLSATRSASNLLDPVSLYAASVNAAASTSSSNGPTNNNANTVTIINASSSKIVSTPSTPSSSSAQVNMFGANVTVSMKDGVPTIRRTPTTVPKDSS
jgi:hypothetical protein